MDQTGQYYYQASSDDTPVMTQVQIQEVDEIEGQADENTQNQDAQQQQQQQQTQQQQQFNEIEELENIEAEDNDGDVQGNDDNVVLNSGDQYQTVTIVPSDENPGEVSYVLIVQQPQDGDDNKNIDNQEGEEQDLAVYDFDDNEENNHGNNVFDNNDIDDKSKIMKYTPKKSQSVSVPHMCNYCNYTSPKRYLLSRHLKSHSEERPHKCSVCERGFKTLASLQNHVNTHTGTKPHSCKFCESAFTTSGNLFKPIFPFFYNVIFLFFLNLIFIIFCYR